MPLKTFGASEFNSSTPIKVEPLTIKGFAKFGSIVSPDEEIATSATNTNATATANANYGTAIKLRKVSQVANHFSQSSSPQSQSTNLNIFRCFPPIHAMSNITNHSFQYTGKVLERHRYSSQTFTPMGRARNKVGYIVVCCLSDDDDPNKLPDPQTIEAFYCMANQAVTYGPGTWHAPMIAVSEGFGSEVSVKPHDFLDFQVLISENDVDDDDCQECYFEPGFVLSMEGSEIIKD
ncbi:ureidoglycolate hydrolase [Saccharomycopsis crataegensis]|uniref:Ureidoglycolate hydrolase n=1 Tax=Saccharomycopsis crataegensis TaxID=43959 RepID=A0AAV5QPW5_9ASCO|nr:ureidoglycolate hydrolase [Saccharomycopsis crataegensis]